MNARSVTGALLALLALLGIVLFVHDRGTQAGLENVREEPAARNDRAATTLTADDAETNERQVEPDGVEPIETESVTLDEARWPPGAAIRIRAVHADTLAPLPGFRLSLWQDVGARPDCVVTTDDDGTATTPAIFQRGTIDVQHETQPAPSHYPDPWEIVAQTFLLETGTNEVAEFEVHARGASLEVLVQALRADGSPVVGRSVELVEGKVEDGGEIRYYLWRFADTNADGIARFLLYGRGPLDSPFAIGMHEADTDEVWDTTYLEPPIHEGPWVLQLYLGGSAAIHVVDHEARPVEGAQVFPAILGHGIRGAYTDVVETNAEGLAHFASLPTGEFVVRAVDRALERSSTDVRFELERGAHAEVTVQLPPAKSKELAVSGTVLGVDGKPLEKGWVNVSVDRAPPQRVTCDENGRFEAWSLRGESVVVDTRISIYGDPFEPVQVEVPFGTTDLTFEKTQELELTKVIFRVLDAATGKPIAEEHDPSIAVYRAPANGERLLASALYGPDEGVTEIGFAPHPDLRWCVTALGYREQRGELPVPDQGAETPIYTIELERGFEREVVIRDQRTGRRIANATVRSDMGLLLAATDQTGSARIELDEWPGFVTIEHEGYLPLRWEAAMHWFQVSDQAWLVPTD